MEVIIEQKRKTKKWKKPLIWTLIILALLIIAAIIFANFYSLRSLPKTTGQVYLKGVNKPVDVTRDEKGVPHIKAQSLHDLFFAQGYVVAQDRLFQMDLSRRQASGQLSEVIGEATVNNDKFFRTLGLRRAAESSYSIYDSESKNALKWFADGVNAYMKEAIADKKLPIEFTLLNYQPNPWTPIDSLTIGKYMAFDLGGHWEAQAFNYWALKNLPEEKAKDLLPKYPKDAPLIISQLNDTNINIEKSFAEAISPPEFNGSNNWVVSGDKSESGKPLLADDPHLSLATPSIWYQMHLQAEDINVSGVIFAGIPGIILGANEHIAWGVTNTGPDVQDLYIEKRNPKNSTQFLYNDKWYDASVVDEPIKVKGKKTIPYKVTITKHGPVISEFAYKNKDNTVFSMQWTALEASKELEAVLNMNKATNWNEFESALKDFHTPTQNFVFASNDGTIAYKANGKIPIRKKGDGLLPVPGWTDEYGWKGYIPYDELPKTINPKEGFISSANNKVIDDSYPYHISHVWTQPYRQMRIQEVLKEKDKLSVKDMQELQMDQTNLYAREFVPLLLNVLNDAKLSDMEKEALNELKNWDFTDDKDKAAPLIFHLWMKEIPKILFEGTIPNKVLEIFEGKQQVVDNILRDALKDNEGPWVKEKGGVKTVLSVSLNHVLEKLSKQYGSNPTKWKWGKYHQLYFAHPISGVSDILKFFFNNEKPVAIGGSQVTVQAASYKENGIVDHGASWRFVIDTNDMQTGYHIVGPGQSGNFRSKWYHDQIVDWVDGNYHKTTLNESALKGDKLTLLPKNK
ncbi:penicillin acylase family protein [Heyndrickxia sp. NPDC080065]|uniref:penicillin acylase family protein n=1 Tax=Heyndrickxia sp. NPDC080065 TaxID=3390568 RepID=UPI003D06E418